MLSEHRLKLAIGVLILLGGFAALGRWYTVRHHSPGALVANIETEVVSGDDRGPGSLREALFLADSATGKASIVIRVKRITIATSLPPLVNSHGLSISAAQPGVELDAHALGSGPVLDVDGANASISGLVVRNCPASAILVRADGLHLASLVIESCDAGVDVAAGTRDLAVDNCQLSGNRVGVRFAGPSRNTLITGSQFSANKDAGIWAVRAEQDDRDDSPILVRFNRFDKDRIGILAGNIAVVIEHNTVTDPIESAVHLVGSGAVVRENQINGGASMGIVTEGARSATIEDNELERQTAYAILVKGSGDVLVKSNRIHSGGYGIGFVLGDEQHPNTATDNSILEERFDGIDVVGESPVLRRNHVVNAHALPLHVTDYDATDGHRVPAHPQFDANDWGPVVMGGAPNTAVAAQSGPHGLTPANQK